MNETAWCVIKMRSKVPNQKTPQSCFVCGLCLVSHISMQVIFFITYWFDLVTYVCILPRCLALMHRLVVCIGGWALVNGVCVHITPHSYNM